MLSHQQSARHEKKRKKEKKESTSNIFIYVHKVFKI